MTHTLRQAVAEASLALSIIGHEARSQGNDGIQATAEDMSRILSETLSSYTAMSPVQYLTKYHPEWNGISKLIMGVK